MNVLIFGLGLNQGGVGSAKFFASQDAKVRVTDLKSESILKPSVNQLKHFPNIKYTLGVHKYEDIDWSDLIIKNPAVKPENPYMKYALKKGKRVEQDMGIFLGFVKPSQIIGITGTKGKSTTASLIYKVLIQSNKKVILAGNIGTNVLENIPKVTPDTLVILEISSFQLEAFDQHKVSPKWAVITNITEDHLNYYKTMDEYVNAKRIIGKYQTKDGLLFIRKNDPIVDKSKFLRGLKGKIIHFSKNDLPINFNPHLIGEHNLENFAAAFGVGKAFGIDRKKMVKIFSEFKGVPFRMELIKEWRGVKIYNDTTATNPDATINAIESLGEVDARKEQNIILICGGMNKGMNYDQLTEAIDWYTKAVYFLEGDVVDEIIHNMKDQTIIEGRFDNFEKLLTKLKNDIKNNPYFKKGDIILFSPAATSFNLFQNEFDRGRKFNEAVLKIFR